MASKEEKFLEDFNKILEGKVTDVVARRPRRIYAKATVDILEIVKLLNEKMGVNYIGTITGLDTGAGFEVKYHFEDASRAVLFTITVALPSENAELNTITPIIPGAIYYERELVDVLGINVKNLPAGNRYPLPEDWPANQYPLRKTWKADEYIKNAEVEACQK